MAHTLTVDPDDDSLGWLVFVDRRPVVDFNRDLQALLNLQPGTHRLVVDARGPGATVTVTIDGGAVLSESEGWPLTVSVPNNKTGKVVAVEFTT